MMFIESIAKELYPQIRDRQLSTTCLCTSNPVYLIFTGEQSYPEIAVRLSESDNIFQAHNILVELYKLLGDLVPEPLTQTKYGSKFISVQRGLKGTPWFQLAGNINSREQWDSLRAEAVETLNILHKGIQTSNIWTRTCNPGEELRQCYQECINSGINLPAKTEALVSKLGNELDKLGNIAVYPQHGDYCLNNLIVEQTKMHIIDFEDFGMTYMPLHDQFTLALSTYQLAPEYARTPLTNNINLCLGRSLDLLLIDKHYVSGFFMHHLLLRLGEWSKNRLPYRKWLLSILEMFVNDENLITK